MFPAREIASQCDRSEGRRLFGVRKLLLWFRSLIAPLPSGTCGPEESIQLSSITHNAFLVRVPLHVLPSREDGSVA